MEPVHRCSLSFLAGIAQQIFDQRGDNQNDDNPDGDMHGRCLGKM
jgi:hypothetical protein